MESDIDMDLIAGLRVKIDDGTLDAEDIPTYLDVISQVANASEEIQEEAEDWSLVIQFVIEGATNVSLTITDGHFTFGTGLNDDADVTLFMDGLTATQLFSGNLDATSAYMAGDLKITGALPDAIKFRTISEIVREEIQDMDY